MAVVGIKIKILPESVEALDGIKANIEAKLLALGAIRISAVEEGPIAFGLKALLVTFAWPEELETSIIEEMKLEGISSLEIVDYRRAFG